MERRIQGCEVLNLEEKKKKEERICKLLFTLLHHLLWSCILF
jgi:hypothetical protein